MQDGTYRVVGEGFAKRLELVEDLYTGYWVASTSVEHEDEYTDYSETAWYVVKKTGCEFVGVWTANKKTYVDASHYVENIYQAIALGQYWKQYAIWDIKHNSEIWVR